MKKLIRSEFIIYLLVMIVYYTTYHITSLSSKEVVFVTFLAAASTLILTLIWRPAATIIFPALTAGMITLAAWAGLAGTGGVINSPLLPNAAALSGIVLIAFWTARKLKLGVLWVFLSFMCEADLIYFLLIR